MFHLSALGFTLRVSIIQHVTGLLNMMHRYGLICSPVMKQEVVQQAL